jgi:hypothetical protein
VNTRVCKSFGCRYPAERGGLCFKHVANMAAHVAKLTLEQVTEIRYLYGTGQWTQKDLGALYGVSRGNISRIVRGETWSGGEQRGC